MLARALEAFQKWIARPEVQYFLAVSGCFWCLGLMLGALGPILLELARRTHTHVESIGIFVSARGLGYILGTVTGGSLLDWGCPTIPLLGLSMAFASLATMALTLSYNFALCIFILITQGLSMGILDSGGNVSLLWAFRGKDVGPYLQAIHFFFAFGSFVSPLVVGRIMDEFVQSFNLAYYILAGAFIPLILFIFIGLKDSDTQSDEPKETAADDDTVTGLAKLKRVYCSFSPDEVWVILLTSIFLGFYVGAEAGTGTLIYTYVVKQELGSEVVGYTMTTVFWAAIAFGRLLAIPLSIVLTGMKMLFFNLVGCLLAPILILIWKENVTVLWVGTVLYGIAMASSFPTAFVVAESMMFISGTAASFFVIGSGLGEVIIPILVSGLFGTPLGYYSVVYSMLVCAVIGFVAWLGYAWRYKSMESRGALPHQNLDEKITETELPTENSRLIDLEH